MVKELVIANISDRVITDHDDIGPLLFDWRITSEQLHNIRFGRSDDHDTFKDRLLRLLCRTGEEIANNPLPSGKQKLCGACHENTPDICGPAFNCLKSFLNDHCLHGDYAAKNPFLEHVLFVLHAGGFIAREEFVSLSAFFRVLGQKKKIVDDFARDDDSKNFLQDHYGTIFDTEIAAPMSFADFCNYDNTPGGRILHIKRIQILFSQKAKQTIQSSVQKIKSGVRERITIPRRTNLVDDLIFDIGERYHSLETSFWQTSAPILRM